MIHVGREGWLSLGPSESKNIAVYPKINIFSRADCHDKSEYTPENDVKDFVTLTLNFSIVGK